MCAKRKVCICSVVAREAPFAGYRLIASFVAEKLGFEPVRNPETPGMIQERFEDIIKNENPIVLYIVGQAESEVTSREVKLALECGCDIHVFCEKSNGKHPSKALEQVKDLSTYLHDNCCALFDSPDELSNHIEDKLTDTSLQYHRGELHLFSQSQAYLAYQQAIKVARTKVLIGLPASPIIAGGRYKYELSLIKTLRDWLRTANSSASFIHIYSRPDTQRIAKRNGVDLVKQCIELEDELKSYKTPCSILATENLSAPFVLTDQELIASIKIGNSDFVFKSRVNFLDCKSLALDEFVLEKLDATSVYNSLEGINNLGEEFENLFPTEAA